MKKGLGIFLLLVSFALIGTGTYYLFQDKEFTVTFSGADGIEPVVVKEGSYVKKPTDPTKTGYKFSGWYYEGKEFDFNTKITKDIILEAKWIAATVEPTATEFTVTFNNENAVLIKAVRVQKGALVSKIEDPVKEGYKFVGWYNGAVAYDFSSSVMSDLVLTAKFEEAKKYTVTFNSDGGSSVAEQTIEEGKTVTKPANPTKSGYTFVSWQLDGKNYDFATVVTADITLKATWTKDTTTTTKKYTVKFDSQGGSTVAAQTVEEGKTATKPNAPTKAGYTFVRWESKGKEYNFSTKVTSNITLVAVWKSNGSCTIIFNSNGGTAVDSQGTTCGFKATKPADPTREFYKFKGWYLNGKAFDFSTPVTSNITLVAQWEAAD